MNRSISLVIMVAFLFSFEGCAEYRAEVTVKNSSSQKIKELVVSLGDEEKKTINFSPGEEVKWAFKVPGDSSYSVKVEFENGNRIEKKVGYLTSGMHSSDEMRIEKKDVFLSQRAHKAKE